MLRSIVKLKSRTTFTTHKTQMCVIRAYLSKAAQSRSSLRWTAVESDAEMNSEYEINPVWSESICDTEEHALGQAGVAAEYDRQALRSSPTLANRSAIDLGSIWAFFSIAERNSARQSVPLPSVSKALN